MLAPLLVLQFVVLAIALIDSLISLYVLPIRVGRFRSQIPPAPDWVIFLSFTLGCFLKISFIISGIVSGAIWVHEGVESKWEWRRELLLDCVLSSTVFAICQLLNVTFYRNEHFEERWLEISRAATKWAAWLPFSCCMVSLVLVFARSEEFQTVWPIFLFLALTVSSNFTLWFTLKRNRRLRVPLGLQERIEISGGLGLAGGTNLLGCVALVVVKLLGAELNSSIARIGVTLASIFLMSLSEIFYLYPTIFELQKRCKPWESLFSERTQCSADTLEICYVGERSHAVVETIYSSNRTSSALSSPAGTVSQ